jgi:hypothetical protein
MTRCVEARNHETDCARVKKETVLTRRREFWLDPRREITPARFLTGGRFCFGSAPSPQRGEASGRTCLILGVHSITVPYGTVSERPEIGNYFLWTNGLNAVSVLSRGPPESAKSVADPRGRHGRSEPAPQSANGSATRIVSSRSGLVESIATGAPISSSTRRMYLTAAAGRSAHERAPRVDSRQPGMVS